MEKCCRCSNQCQWGSPCLLSPAGVCPSCEGHQAFCTAPKSLVFTVPPCPVSRHGHMALLSEQQWLPVHLPVCVPGCLYLSVCLSGHSSRQGELRLCAAAFRRAKCSEWPSSHALFCCLFARLLRFVAAAEIKEIEVVCLCECIVLRGYRHNSHIPHA